MNRLKLISFHRGNAMVLSVSNSDFMCVLGWGVNRVVFCGKVQCNDGDFKTCELESLAFKQ